MKVCMDVSFGDLDHGQAMSSALVLLSATKFEDLILRFVTQILNLLNAF